MTQEEYGPSNRWSDHRVLIYREDGHALGTVLAFLRAGLAVGEPALVTVGPTTAGGLRSFLGTLPAGLTLVESASWWRGTNPGTLMAYDRQVRRLLATGASRCRVVAESPWQARTEGREWRRYEAASNVHFAALPVSLLCLCDARVMPPEVVADVRRTHPVVVGEGRNGQFVDPGSYVAGLDLPGAAPPSTCREATVGRRGVSTLRRLVTAHAAEAGLPEERRRDLGLATTEAATNALRHGGTPARVRTWTEGRRFVCEVSDQGTGLVDPLAGYLPPGGQPGGSGLWLVRSLCEDTVVTSSPMGTVVRLSVPLDPPGRSAPGPG